MAKTLEDGLYSEGTVRGLYLRVRGGNRSWIFRRQVEGRRVEIGLGAFADVGIIMARTKAVAIRGLAPEEFLAQYANRVKKTLGSRDLFGNVYEKYITFKNETDPVKHPEARSKFIRKWLLPEIGRIPLEEVTSDIIADALNKIPSRSPVKDIKFRLNDFFSWCKAKGIYSGENPADRFGALKYLAPTQKKTEDKHYGMVSPALVRPVLAWVLERRVNRSLDSYLGLLMGVLTTCRQNTLTEMRWENIDFERKVWRIPAEYMKMSNRGTFEVPLSEQAMTIISWLPKREFGKIFPTLTKSKMWWLFHDVPIEWARDEYASREKGKDVRATVHGLCRATFRSWAQSDEFGNDKKYSKDVAEMCLHHKTDDPLNGAYDRNKFLVRRREMLQDWADFCIPLDELKDSNLALAVRINSWDR